MQQRLQPLVDILQRAHYRYRRRHGYGQEQLRRRAAQHCHCELIFELAVQLTGSVLRDKLHRLRCGKRKRRQRIYHCGALCAVAYDRVAGAVVHLHLVNAVHTAHVIFQHISLVQRHPRAFEMHTQPPARLMDYFAFHNSLPLACRKAQVPPAAAAV